MSRVAAARTWVAVDVLFLLLNLFWFAEDLWTQSYLTALWWAASSLLWGWLLNRDIAKLRHARTCKGADQ